MDGYFALNFNGESIGLLFALPAHRKFVTEREKNSELMDDNGTLTEVGIAYLIYFGYENWCISERLRPPYKHSYAEFLSWTEDLFFDPKRAGLLVEISECYKNSKTINRDATEPEKEIDEKNEIAQDTTMTS